MKTYNEYLNEGVLQNIKDSDFNGGDPESIQVHNQGVGGVQSLQGMRKRIVQLLEQMLKSAKSAEKNHSLAHYNIQQVLNLANPKSTGGVLLKYLENHQKAVEELEQLRKKGGKGAGKTVPKNLT